MIIQLVKLDKVGFCQHQHYWTIYQYIKGSHNAINLWQDKVTILKARGQHHGVAALQGEGQLAEQLADSLAFLGSLAPGQCSSNLLHLNNCAGMKSPQGLHSEGQELKSFVMCDFFLKN